MSKVLFGNKSRKISKHFNGRALCPDLLKALWLQYLPEDETKSIHTVYKMIDRTNDWEYVGAFKATSFSKFATYVGSGTLLRYMIAKKGIQNFDFHFMAFFDNKEDAAQMERNLVSPHYLKNANSYNLMIGGLSKNAFGKSTQALHCQQTGKTFFADTRCADKIRDAFGFADGYSQQTREGMKRTAKTAVKNEGQKVYKMDKDFGNGDWEQLQVSYKNALPYLHSGWSFSSSRVWIHKPSATNIYTRGKNWKQILTHNKENVINYLQNGWVLGRPPRFNTQIEYKSAGQKKRGRRVKGKYIDKKNIQAQVK